MAKMTIKTTLDVETVRALETLAQRWRVSKSEVVRRAIRMAANRDARNSSTALNALDQLQTSLRERNVDITGWVRNLKAERSTLRRSARPGSR
ncbi:MAG: ribbon-helix-helix protein, CopG family [Deltaproteobacteria bacterium]|nr:ribbon-helix-helix protein, CopG family [Deltaproteobacteria bacterium]